MCDLESSRLGKMEKRMIHRIALLSLLLSCALLHAQSGTQESVNLQTAISDSSLSTPVRSPDLNVIYTGKLFGYFRLDCDKLQPNQAPEQLADPESCSLPKSEQPDTATEPDKSSAVKDSAPSRKPDKDKNAVNCFLKKLGELRAQSQPKQKEQSQSPILVGMGDNFAPRLEARMEKDGTDQWWKPRQKSPDEKDPVGYISDIQKDPVACLLRAARYDAVVVGREDFDLGPERIRNIATFLSSSDARVQVPILGANVVFNVHYKNPGDPVPDEQKKRGFDPIDRQPYFQPLSSPPFFPTLRYLEFNVVLATNGEGEDGEKSRKLSPETEKKLAQWEAFPLDFNSQDLFSDMLGGKVQEHTPGNQGHFQLCGPYADLDQPSSNSEFADPRRRRCAEVKTSALQILWKDTWEPLSSHADAVDTCRKAILQELRSRKQPFLSELRDKLPPLQKACAVVIEGENIDLTKPVVPSVRLRWRIDARNLPAKASELNAGTPSPGHEEDFTGDRSYRFCIVSRQSEKGLYCQVLPVRRPLFKINYVYLPDKNTVIFGVVDPGLRGELPDPQGSWLEGKDRGRKVEIDTVDPAAALVQAEDAFNAFYCKSNPDCKFRGRKILLAQMEAHRAEDLRSSLKPEYSMDIVITEADRNRATPRETVRIPNQSSGDKAPIPVLVPPSPFDDATKDVYSPLAEAHLKDLGAETELVAANHAKEKLKWYEDEKTTKEDKAARKDGVPEHSSALIGLTCPNFTKGEPTGDPAPKMLGLLRCAAKEYLFKTAEREDVLPDSQKHLGVISPSSEFTDAVLQIMRHSGSTDLAMLERRELYGVVEAGSRSGAPEDTGDPDKNDPGYLRKFLDRVFWENSTLQKITISGSTLKKVLKQSDTFKAREESTTETVPIRGRYLLLSGLRKGPGEDAFFINGKPVEDTIQYSVATSERMLTINSDYPDLRKDLAGETVEIDSSKRAVYLSFAVCKELSKTKYLEAAKCKPATGLSKDYETPEEQIFAKRAPCNSKLAILQDNWCDPDTSKRSYTADMLDPKHGMSFSEKLLSSLALLTPKDAANPLQIPKQNKGDLVTGAELADQFQRTHRLSVSELSIAFSSHYPDQNAQQLSDNFNSAVISSVKEAQSSTWDVKNTSRFTASHYVIRGHGLDLYMSDDVAFSSIDKSQTGVFPHSITLNSNQWSAVPAGLTVNLNASLDHLLRRKPDRTLPIISVILEPSRFTGQLIKTDNFIESAGVDVPQDRTISWAPRVGLRAENQLSYIESGAQFSRDWRIPIQFVFTPAGGNTFICDANTLKDCLTLNAASITPVMAIHQVNEYRQQLAWYVDSLYKFPLHRTKKIYYILKNKGELYNNSKDDTSVLTRYDYTMTNSISIPIFGNLAIEPNVELFWYENKRDFNDLFKHSYTIKLNYTIGWGTDRVRFKEANKSSPYSNSASGSTK